MNDIQEDTITKKEKDYTDLESLLEAAKLSEFEPELGYTEENQGFVKFESFFEIVKSTETAKVDVQEKNDGQKFDEDIADELKNSSEGDSSGDVSEMDLAKPSTETEEDNSSQTEVDSAEETSEDEDINDIVADKSIEETGIQKEEYSAIPDDQKDNTPDITAVEIDETISSEETFDSDLEKNAFERGRSAAIEEFEKSMELEKQSLQELTETLFLISDKFQQETESLIKRKLLELFDELIGAKMKEFQEPFVKKIKLAAENIMAGSTEISLELNRFDLKILEANAEVKNLGFKVFENDQLRRGEFNLIKNSSGFQQKIID
tara:strand:+ start:162 stop:1124 length:963 start_codon:yes stop_codon:yes gene_type:complete